MEFIATAMKTITLPFERKITGKSFNDKKKYNLFFIDIRTKEIRFSFV